MTNTFFKFEEAGFFLQHMETNYLNLPEFDYYLSAFISSARSVLWIMKYEFQKTEGWESWYDSKDLSVDEEQFFKSINEIRVRSVKKVPLETGLSVELFVPEKNLSDEFKQFIDNAKGQRVIVNLKTVDEEKVIESRPTNGGYCVGGNLENFFHTLNEFPDEDILDVCKRYYAILKEIVLECKELFG